MKIQNFIFCWNSYVPEALSMDRELSRIGKTTVVNSCTSFDYGRWINIDDGYFSEQWNTLLSNIDDDTDFVFHIQADAKCPDFEKLFSLFREAAGSCNIGVYAPDVDFTPCVYDPEKLYHLSKMLCRVPNTDCTCWFIRASLLREGRRPLFNINTNKYGWGVDWYYIARSHLENLEVIRDYGIQIRHPRGRNYNDAEAHRHFMNWIFEQDIEIMEKIGGLMGVYEPLRLKI